MIIFSHGNSCDLGVVYLKMLDIAFNLKINVLIYEYIGYGEYKGQINDKQIIIDI